MTDTDHNIIHRRLIKNLEDLDSLNDRYENLTCVSGQEEEIHKRRGTLSLVFQAVDRLTGDLVALKFIHPRLMTDKYEINAFEREPEIIALLEGKKRCLQLKSEISSFKWDLDSNSNEPMFINCSYFATEWLEEDLDDFFYRQDEFSAEEKLYLFKQIVLGIDSIHNQNISHRDIKINNLKLKITTKGSVVVAIDFGRAAELNSPNLSPVYGNPVGADAYSSPEMFAGFAGYRKYGKLTDIYALGTLFYELFNTNSYHIELANSTDFQKITYALATEVAGFSKEDNKVDEWCKRAKLFRHRKTAPEINADGNSIPASIDPLVVDLYSGLVKFDFRQRLTETKTIYRKIDSMIKVLRNHRSEQIAIEKRKILRQKKIEKSKRKEERLDSYLQKRLIENATT